MPEDINLIKLSDFKDVSSLYVIADLRGFSAWSRKNQPEVRKLTKLLYSIAIAAFGRRSDVAFNRRIVKFLGDGFFAISEYNDDDPDNFKVKLSTTIAAIRSFMASFYKAVSNSNLHDRSEIKISFGLSYGNSFRFHLAGQPLDYIGEKVNLASRLCGIANPSEIVMEYDLKDHLQHAPEEVANGLRYKDDRVDLKSYGDSVVCRINDPRLIAYEHTEFRFLSALVDSIKPSNT